MKKPLPRTVLNEITLFRLPYIIISFPFYCSTWHLFSIYYELVMYDLNHFCLFMFPCRQYLAQLIYWRFSQNSGKYFLFRTFRVVLFYLWKDKCAKCCWKIKACRNIWASSLYDKYLVLTRTLTEFIFNLPDMSFSH